MSDSTTSIFGMPAAKKEDEKGKGENQGSKKNE